MRILITTKFTDDWYKNKFKSGLLNKAIMMVKTDAMSRVTPDNKVSMANHKYTKDEELSPGEKSK
jgi:hypothetical protein